MMRIIKDLINLIFPLALLALAWAGGEIRNKEASIISIGAISSDIVGLTQINEKLFRGHRKANPDEFLYIGIADKPSYGGPTRVAVVINEKKELEHVAILSSNDTFTYIEKAVGLGILDSFTGRTLDNMPQVDGITGATMSSTAIIRGLEQATAQIGATAFGMPPVAATSPPPTPEKTKIILICFLFAGALTITSKRFPWNRKNARFVLLGSSLITLGFLYGAQFSLSTIVALLGSGGLQGMASYAAVLCLVLAVFVFFFTRKNLYCSYICPFGAVQEGLGQITGCTAPSRSQWMILLARGWTLTILAAALFFHSPSDAIYEPFGMAFNFIGSSFIFALTILIVISSLAFKRPWCLLFCPITCVFDYLQLVRRVVWPRSKKQFPLHTTKRGLR
ncbi:MAG: 4Fe-4S binding protein [Desulforhopalus sp.]